MKTFPLRLSFGMFGVLAALGYSALSCAGLIFGIVVGLKIGGNTAPFKYGFSATLGLLIAYEAYRNFRVGWIAFSEAAPTRRLYAPDRSAKTALNAVVYVMASITAAATFLTLESAYEAEGGCLALAGLVAACALLARYLGMRLGWNRAYQAWSR